MRMWTYVRAHVVGCQDVYVCVCASARVCTCAHAHRSTQSGDWCRLDVAQHSKHITMQCGVCSLPIPVSPRRACPHHCCNSQRPSQRWSHRRLSHSRRSVGCLVPVTEQRDKATIDTHTLSTVRGHMHTSNRPSRMQNKRRMASTSGHVWPQTSACARAVSWLHAHNLCITTTVVVSVAGTTVTWQHAHYICITTTVSVSVAGTTAWALLGTRNVLRAVRVGHTGGQPLTHKCSAWAGQSHSASLC